MHSLVTTNKEGLCADSNTKYLQPIDDLWGIISKYGTAAAASLHKTAET